MSIDVLYVPSRDVAADVRFYRDTLGARVVFPIEAMGTRLAEARRLSYRLRTCSSARSARSAGAPR